MFEKNLSELDVVRKFMALSKESFGLDNGLYPLGSCTMKANPKLNDHLANLDGFKYVHPHQPQDSMQGLLELLYDLQNCLAEITGMDAISLQGAAGAQGELAGVLIIKKYFLQKDENRSKILVADSAHGTNLASAAMASFYCDIVRTKENGELDVDDLIKKVDKNTAGLMLTNPSTLGIFETNISHISKILHNNGSLLYYDGANMNALMGIVRPGDMGFDIVHMNVHKTLSTPHGGGGPGAGPLGVKSFLSSFLPVPIIAKIGDKYILNYNIDNSIGKIKSFFGHVGVLIRAYCYMISQGHAGLKKSSQIAVKNANYIRDALKEYFPSVYDAPCMHECLLSLEKLDFPAESFAKRMLDYGIHPPTLVGGGCVYYPDRLKNAFLIEPTESESQENLDKFIDIMKKIRLEVLQDPEKVKSSPYSMGIKKIKK